MDTITGSLAGKFLVSTPSIPDSRFARQVIFICSHTEKDGAMGLAVNSPYGKISFSEVLGERMPPGKEQIVDIYVGGPVEPEAGFVLFETADYSVEGELQITDSIAISREKCVLEDLASGKGPENYLLILGYAGWGAGQLEMELTRSGWLVVPASNDIIFRMDNKEKWQAAANAYGIDITLFDDEAGNA